MAVKTFMFFAKCYCLLLFTQLWPVKWRQWRQYSRYPQTALSVSKKYFFKIWFLDLRFILLCQILCTPFKLTEKCWTLVYINGSFILTQLMQMFYCF